MTGRELHILLNELCSQQHELQWLEFKMNEARLTMI